jgi:hypothetical protein
MLHLQARASWMKMLFVFFAVLFAAILIHPDLDLADVPDVRIPNLRASSSVGSPVQPSPALHQVARFQRHREFTSSTRFLPVVWQVDGSLGLPASVRVLRI